VAKPEAVLLTAERSPIASRRSVDYPHRCVQEAEGGTARRPDDAQLVGPVAPAGLRAVPGSVGALARVIRRDGGGERPVGRDRRPARGAAGPRRFFRMLLSPRSFRSKVSGSFYPPSSSGVGALPTRPHKPLPRRTPSSDRPTRPGSSFAARCLLYACRPRLVNGYLTQMAPGDTTVGTTPCM
jgi:hypothetical protein